jgi:Kelch motif
MLGGWLNNETVAGWGAPPLATANLIKYDMETNSWTNNTGPDLTGRAEGVLSYIPASDAGLLIYFGGGSTPGNNETLVGVPMNIINIYDIASSKWYTQQAGGQVPEMRRRFCAGATWAKDQSSYQIYLYGGMGFGANVSGYDDVYILSMPSFTWIKWWSSDPTSAKPHNSLTCNVIDGAQ